MLEHVQGKQISAASHSLFKFTYHMIHRFRSNAVTICTTV